MYTRKLGKSKLSVSALGLGCWAIGGETYYLQGDERLSLHYGTVDDSESLLAIRKAIDLGVNFFDTADAYGCGHSESILGQAIEGHRDDVVISTKFGNVFDEPSKTWLGHPDPPITRDYLFKQCEASLNRLKTDFIDLYLFHWKDYDASLVSDLVPLLDDLVDEGLIRYYGWSTPFIEQAQELIKGGSCIAIQYNYNVFERNPQMLDLCSKFNQASITRGPFAMGLLTGKYSSDSKFPKNDMRHSWWNLQDGRQAQQLKLLDSIQEILTRDGRSLIHGSLCWLWALNPLTIPIPGFRSVKQVKATIQALDFGPLSKNDLEEIDQILQPFLNDMVILD